MYIEARARTGERGESFATGEVHSTPSFHGLLIPNFTDNGRGAGFFFFFYADTLVEPCFNGGEG